MRANGKQIISDIAGSFASALDVWKARVRGVPVAEYRAAKVTRWTPINDGNTNGASADSHYRSEWDYFRLVESALEFDRDDIVAGAAVNRFCANVLQGGFTYDPHTGSEVADEILKARVRMFCESPAECDLAGEHNLHQLAMMALRGVVVPGDILALMTNAGSVQLIENHRLRTPRDLAVNDRDYVIHGVRLDGNRKRLGYYITKDDIALNKFPRFDDTRYVPARNEFGARQVLHIYHPKRVTQTRGVTKFANIADAVRMHDDIQFAKLVQQQSVSVWAWFRQRDLGFELPEGVRESVHYEADPARPGEVRPIRNVSAGMELIGYPGEKLHGFSPNVPSPTFFDHATSIQQLIAINLDVPLIIVLLDATQTNFSGWRGAMEQAKIQFRAFQRWMSMEFHRPIIEWKLGQWSDPNSPFADPAIVALRRAGIDVFAHEWIYPSWPYVQPMEEASADLLEMRNSLTSPRRIQMKRGADWETVTDEMIADRALLIRKAKQAAIEINQEYDDERPVTWEQLAFMPTPDGVQYSISEQPHAEQETPDNADKEAN